MSWVPPYTIHRVNGPLPSICWKCSEALSPADRDKATCCNGSACSLLVAASSHMTFSNFPNKVVPFYNHLGAVKEYNSVQAGSVGSMPIEDFPGQNKLSQEDLFWRSRGQGL
jgi:hypothetical protein